MKEDTHRDDFATLCVRYLAGEADSSERKTLVEALQDPEHKSRFESIQDAWNCVPKPALKNVDVGRAFAALRLEDPPAPDSRAKRRWRPAGVIGALAGVLALTMMAFGLFRYAQSLFSDPSAGEPRWLEKHNDKGQRSEISMADGTHITLNADSTLMISENDGDRYRTVRLSGEALFEVSHDDEKPFTVELGGLHVTVLGTTFNVSAYPDDGFDQISLLSGKLLVTLSGPDGEPDQYMLAPGEAFRLDRATNHAAVVAFEADDAIAWTDNRIVFRNEQMDQVVRDIERRFGVPVVLKDPTIRDMAITGTFDREGLGDILRVICFTTGLNFDTVVKNGRVSKIVIDRDQ